MKKPLSFVFCLLILVATVLSQTTETFDIATYQPPPDWKKVVKDGVIIYNTSNDKTGGYAMIVLYKSGVSSGDAKTDFDADWRQFVANQLGMTGTPQLEPARRANGWEMMTGGAAFKNEQGPGVAALTTFSGNGRTFSVSALFNSEEYLAAIEVFVSSIRLAVPVKPAPVEQSAGESADPILGTWGMSSSGAVTAQDYKNPYAVNNYGYRKGQYTFNADGTYTYVSKTFKSVLDKILLVRENGTFRISGNMISIVPQKSVIESWSKRDGTDKWGRLLTTQSRPLEKVNYRFTKHYFSGIQTWNLVLQADSPTDRDGPFSNNTTFSNAWYYAPISVNNTAVDLP